MIPGVPVVTRIEGDSSEAVAGQWAETSIFAGRATWTLTLAELFERCAFASNKVIGFWVLDGARRSLSHHLDIEGEQEAAMTALIQAAAEAEADGWDRFTLEATGDSPSCRWLLRRSDGTSLNPLIVAPSVGGLGARETVVLNVISPRESQETLRRVIEVIDDALATGTTRHWVCLASQRSQVLTFWHCNLGSSTLPDFTAEAVGNELLDASFGYRAQLENP